MLDYSCVVAFAALVRLLLIAPFMISDVLTGTAEDSPVNREHITFNIYGRSHAAIKAAKDAIRQLRDKESTEVILRSEQDRASITTLTQAQVAAYLVKVL